MRTFVASATGLCLTAVVGCASPIHIVSPPPTTNNDPVRSVVVQFQSNFNAVQTWSVTLDGTPIAGFSPTPALGVTSTASIEPGSGGFKESNSCDIKRHTLTTSATCGFFCVFGSETVKFTPPSLLDNASSCEEGGNVVELVTTAKSVYVQHAASVPIHVKIRDISPQQPVFKLGSSPSSLLAVGLPLTITIPAGQLSATYYMQSVVTAAQYNPAFILEFTASGTSSGGTTGRIVPAQ